MHDCIPLGSKLGRRPVTDVMQARSLARPVNKRPVISTVLLPGLPGKVEDKTPLEGISSIPAPYLDWHVRFDSYSAEANQDTHTGDMAELAERPCCPPELTHVLKLSIHLLLRQHASGKRPR